MRSLDDALVPAESRRLTGAKLRNSAAAGWLNATVRFRDEPAIELNGRINGDGTATLVSSDRRTAGALFCAEDCATAVLDVIAVRDGAEVERQFVTEKLLTASEVEDDAVPGDFVGSPRRDEVLAALGLSLQPLESPEQEEKRIGPWLNLKEGGVAVGPPQGPVTVTNPDGSTFQQYGSLVNATPLPVSGPGFRRLSKQSKHDWGTGHMISLLQGASGEFARVFDPNAVILVGGISQQFGGHFPPHKSHQNGLDADVAYVGTHGFDSVLDRDRKVTDRLDRMRNWQYFRLMHGQKIRDKSKVLPSFTMIFVSPEIKGAFCDWASAQGILANADDADIMRRIRPTPSHDEHFHVRLRCSPHHPLCRKQGDPGGGTGCK